MKQGELFEDVSNDLDIDRTVVLIVGDNYYTVAQVRVDEDGDLVIEAGEQL